MSPHDIIHAAVVGFVVLSLLGVGFGLGVWAQFALEESALGDDCDCLYCENEEDFR